MKDYSFKLAKERRYSALTITDTDYTDDIALLANTPAQSKTLLYGLEQAAGDIGHHINVDKTEYMCFNQRGDISETCGQVHLPRKQCLINQEKHQLAKAWTAIDRLLVIWKTDLTDKIKQFFQAVVVSILLHGC